MAVNLITLLQSQFSTDVVSRIASMIGESPKATGSAITSAVPAVLAAMVSKASTSEGASDLVALIGRTGVTASQFSSLPSLLSGESAADLTSKGGSILDALLGGRVSAVVDWVARSAGISSVSASALLRTIAPFVTSLVAREAASGAGLNAESLVSLLGSQRSFLSGVLPSALAGSLGLTDLAASAAPAAHAVAARATGGAGVWKWLLPIAAVVALVVGMRTCRATEPEVARTASAPVSGSGVRSVYGIDLGALVPRTLPGGVSVTIPEKGFEARIIEFVASPRPVADDLWFTLDRLEFETGSAALRPSAQEQVKNVVTILRAYPNVSVKIGGYTDNSGDDAANMKLSQERATNTMSAIVTGGIARERLEAEGYGEQFPVASNDTDEGRQRNRRVDARVTKK